MNLGTRNNNAYIELLKTFPPRPITSYEEFVATQKAISASLGMALIFHEILKVSL